MKYRRWFLFALALTVTAALAAAQAEGGVRLDGIGLRYTPAEGEICLTRTDMPNAALSALAADGQTLLTAMEAGGQYLLSLPGDGRQVTLAVSEKPEALACDDYYDMALADRDQFLTLLARRGGYGSAVWQTDGYALFSAAAERQAQGALSYSDLSLSTLYLGKVYTFRMALIGREAGEADAALLLSMAQRTLRLGAAANAETEAGLQETQPLTLPDTTVASGDAEMTRQSDTCPLTLDPVPATLGVTAFTLTGVPVPEGNLRYSVNGKTSSRVRAEADGAFSILVPSLKGNTDNTVEVIAFKDGLKTVVDFTVTVDWQYAPLALADPGEVTAESVTLNGLALPGSTVKLTKGRGTKSIPVNDDGTFTVTLTLSAIGENAFSLQVRADGYRRTDHAFTVIRAQSGEEQIASLQKQAKNVTYEKVVASPAAYAGKVIRLSGTAGSLQYAKGVPRFVLTTGDGDQYAVLANDLLAITEGAEVALYGTLTGEAVQENDMPVLKCNALLS